MKKIVLLIIPILVFLTGCQIYNINELTEDELVDAILMENSKTNTALKGYKIYLPNNMTLIHDKEDNNILYSNNEKYYLYVDIISYYNKTANNYKINEDKQAIYSKIIDDNDILGYILVTEYEDDRYFVEAMYNHAKIEVITSNYKQALTNSLIVLNSIKYNDKVIESLINSDVLDYDEEEFTIIGPNETTSGFLKWEEDFGTYEDTEGELPDEDQIQIEEAE